MKGLLSFSHSGWEKGKGPVEPRTSGKEVIQINESWDIKNVVRRRIEGVVRSWGGLRRWRDYEGTWWRQSLERGPQSRAGSTVPACQCFTAGPRTGPRSPPGPGDRTGPRCRVGHKGSLSIVLVTTDWRGGVGRCQTYQFCHLCPFSLTFESFMGSVHS